MFVENTAGCATWLRPESSRCVFPSIAQSGSGRSARRHHNDTIVDTPVASAVATAAAIPTANHWKLVVDVHNANHPDADHSCVDLHLEDAAYFPRTDILWASPECTRWSQANGGWKVPAIEEGLFEDPLSVEAATRSRLLMFDVLRFAEHHRYRAMVAENVVDSAVQAQYRLAWQVWREELAKLGYDYRVVSLNSMSDRGT